ncbi:mannose/fructose/sorbose PTS transporter subunit IIB [Bavariicoccus seileri]|uniref:mannose/fructose/sorbose PTS transporter subunit IIB n=1 Tax=Bavariicoccus seileri TaxID=549685 RepID=UPI003F90D965
MTMEVKLVRIDDRLIHGQVATVWTKASRINRILVVNDAVSKDSLRKALLSQAAPPGVRVNVIPISKMIAIWNDPVFNSFKAMLLFTNPHDVKTVVEGGVEISSVNIGSMSFAEGKKMITNAIAVDQQDADAFRFLAERGITLEIRKVVADSRINLLPILKKEGFILPNLLF